MLLGLVRVRLYFRRPDGNQAPRQRRRPTQAQRVSSSASPSSEQPAAAPPVGAYTPHIARKHTG